jgi:hypothetical protein
VLLDGGDVCGNRVRQLVLAPPFLQRQQQQLAVGLRRERRREPHQFLFQLVRSRHGRLVRLRHLAFAEHLVEPAAFALLSRRETRRRLDPLAVAIRHHRVPARRVAGDGTALVHDEPQRVAFLHVERQLRLDTFVVVTVNLRLPDFAFVVADAGADAVAAEMELEHAPRDRHAPVARRGETAHAGRVLAGVMPVLADARPVRPRPERRAIPLRVAIREQCDGIAR